MLGVAIWLGFPTVAAYQDMTSLVAGAESTGSRWNSTVTRAVAGSVHAAEISFRSSPATPGSLSGSGLNSSGVGAVAFLGKSAGSSTPDEIRVRRADKRGRVVKIAPVLPPKAFSAGSVFQRTSRLRATADANLRMAFAVPAIRGREIAIAAAFHSRHTDIPKPDISPVLAALVTSDQADILATAYAPREPDFAKASPFDSLLGQPDQNRGRFIPPVGQGDHRWMQKPLPALVFTEKEQRCLAIGVYFEARGESVQGQAAVAQVILNRVRAPAYPKTICDVVYQNDHLKNRCQFSFACDGKVDRIANLASYRMAEEVAMAATSGKIFNPDIGSSTHYHATYVNPGWSHAMKKMKKIGLHVFYRTKRGGWS